MGYGYGYRAEAQKVQEYIRKNPRITIKDAVEKIFPNKPNFYKNGIIIEATKLAMQQ